MDGGKEDPPGGKSLMDEIQALFAPPGGRDKKETKIVELHPYFKRPGKGHNHDCCDACGEGGNLICCDNCPSSFHLSCHAPPLDDEDIPKGDWVCLRCHYKEVSRSGTISLAQRDQMLLKQEEEFSKKNARPARLAAKKASEAVTSKSKVQKLYRIKYDKYIQSKPLTKSPFDTLIAATQVVNAVEFSLPKDLEVSERLPFSWKWSDEPKEDLDTYPKNCCICQKTSRGVPSLACDYCSSAYHLDCLDPPLCEIPKDTWMCPTHVEHFIDSNLLKSTSFSQRIKLWNKYARAPVDTDSIRVDFFRKINSGKRGSNRLIRSRQKVPMSNRVCVPDIVKAQYKLPGPGFPRERDVPWGLTRDGESDANEWLAGVIALQSSFLNSDHHSLPGVPIKVLNDSKNVTEGNMESKGSLSNNKEEGGGDESDDTASNCSININNEDADILTDEVRASLNEFISRRKSKLKNLPSVVKEFLAIQKAEELFKDYEMPEILDYTSHIRARACFTPLNISKVSCPMKYRSMDIGLGKQNTLDLSRYGHCNYVSSLCATVFYDQYTRVFELMNYSEHGCIVDNSVYCVEPKKLGASSSNSYSLTHGNKHKFMAHDYGNDMKPCHCEMSISQYFRKTISKSSEDSIKKETSQSSISDLNYNLNPSFTNENSAILNHGSYVRFGCLQFVFSIIDFEEMKQPSSPLYEARANAF